MEIHVHLWNQNVLYLAMFGYLKWANVWKVQHFDKTQKLEFIANRQN